MAPPGCGKTLFLRSYTNKYFGILQNPTVQMHTETTITEAGLIGTIKVLPTGETETVPGAARAYHNSIFVIDEFTAIMSAMKSNFNSQLEAQLLTSLDSGDVSKRLAHGSLDYHTSFTLWCGIQPIKANMEGGLGRRLCYLLNIPTLNDQYRYADAAMDADNIEVDIDWLTGYRRKLELWIASLDIIERVSFKPEFYNFLRRIIKCMGYEVDNYRRIALGYHLSKKGASEHVEVCLDEDLKMLMINQSVWKFRIDQEPRIQQIVSILQQSGYPMEAGMFGMTKSEMIDVGSMMQLSATKVHEILLEAVKVGYIKLRGNKICLEPGALKDPPVIQRAKDAGMIMINSVEIPDAFTITNEPDEFAWDDMMNIDYKDEINQWEEFNHG
jgi:hypothetical protein